MAKIPKYGKNMAKMTPFFAKNSTFQYMMYASNWSTETAIKDTTVYP